VILGAKYGSPVDMWSLGCIVAELVTGRPLFAGDDEADQLSTHLEYLGMPPGRLLTRSRRTSEFFSRTTNLPRYCGVSQKSSVAADEDAGGDDQGPAAITGSFNKSGVYRGPPGSKNIEAALIKIIGRERTMDRRHQVYHRETFLAL